MAIPKYTEKHHAVAKEHDRVLFKWEMDKRYVSDENDRCVIQHVGTMSRDKCRRIWEILLEPDPLTKGSSS